MMNYIYKSHSFILFFCLFFFRAMPAAYGGFQARGRIGAVAAGLCLSKARDRTRNLMVPSLIHFHCAMTGTPHSFIL